MKKLIFLVLLFLVFYSSYLISPSLADAALVVVDQKGKLTWQVLSFETENHSSVEVVRIAPATNSNPSSTVSLSRDDGKINLVVQDGSETRTADVTDYPDDIVELKQSQAPQTVKISATNGFFQINQSGISAQTTFPIQIDTAKKVLAIETGSGMQYLYVLPREVVQNLLRANILSKLDSGAISLLESETGELEYQLSGTKNIKLLNVFLHQVPVQAFVSASTGQVLKIDQPIWFSVLDFFLT